MLLVNLIIRNLVKRSARQNITWILSTFSPFLPIPYSLINRIAAINVQEPYWNANVLTRIGREKF